MNTSRIVGLSLVFMLALASAPVGGAPPPVPSGAPTPPPAPLPQPGIPVPVFETRDAVRALDAVNYKFCFRPNEPRGEVVIEVTFQPIGEIATAAALPGGDLSPSSASCVAMVLGRKARMDAYRGKPQKVLYLARLP